jgi:PAS domain-containing protein
MLAAASPQSGIVVCDAEKRILYMNEKLEEMTGIRSDAAKGQDFISVARDQSLGAFIADLFDRAGAAMGGEGPSEDYEFSGTAYKVSASAFGGQGEGASAQCFLLVAIPSGGSE